MKDLELFWLIIKRTSVDKFLYGFIVYFIISCFLIQIFDPNIKNFSDALWFGFNVITSIGLGDYTVANGAARIVTILLGLYGALMFAFIPGVMTTFYTEKVKMRSNESMEQFMDQLEHLDTLSKEDLKKVSDRVKAHQAKK